MHKQKHAEKVQMKKTMKNHSERNVKKVLPIEPETPSKLEADCGLL